MTHIRIYLDPSFSHSANVMECLLYTRHWEQKFMKQDPDFMYNNNNKT